MGAVRRAQANVGTRIKLRREEAKLSLSALAERARVSKGYLWSLENGKASSRPSGRTLYKIAGALGTTMSDLLDEQLLSDVDISKASKTLLEFAKLEGLTDRDVRMLAGINFRGQRPDDLEGWRLVWGAIKASVRRVGA
jgi:transcriptional regulator with XRE-family HTH domain